jgi:hypothetical protein
VAVEHLQTLGQLVGHDHVRPRVRASTMALAGHQLVLGIHDHGIVAKGSPALRFVVHIKSGFRPR